MKKYLFVLIFLISSFSIQAQGIDLNCNSNESNRLTCGQEETIFPLGVFSTELNSLDISADQSEIIGNETYHFMGDVKLISDSHILSSDDLKVSISDESTTAKGNVRFQDDTFLISGTELEVKKDINGISADAINAKYQDISMDSNGANGSGTKISKTPNNVLINDATYSLCPIKKNDWLVKASSINLDLKNNRGKAKNARIEFFGIPILYLPRYSWVLKGRGSGFLTPSYETFNDSTTKKGAYNLSQPYYLNLAPDRDLLIAATYMKYRGFLYSGKYRQIFGRKINDEGENDDSTLIIDSKYMSNDSISNIDRWSIDSSLILDLNDRFNLNAVFKRVSDKKYQKEISRSNEQSLLSQFKLSYLNDEDSLNSYIF